jgi:hypothetical protein
MFIRILLYWRWRRMFLSFKIDVILMSRILRKKPIVTQQVKTFPRLMKPMILLPRLQQHAFCLILSHIQRIRPSLRGFVSHILTCWRLTVSS